MIKANDLIQKFQQAYNEKWGYIWGARGQVWTAKKQAEATREMTVRYGAKWIGRRVADCSGLFYWAFKELGGSIYHGSNTIWNKHCAVKGKLINGRRDDGRELRLGTAVFMYNKTKNNRGHIGLYIGGGKVIEAKGTKSGVVISGVTAWHEWGELKDVLYDGDVEQMEGVNNRVAASLIRGDSGADVERVQRLLLEKGYRLKPTRGDRVNGIDGKFGADTERIIKEFQKDNGLAQTGIWSDIEEKAAAGVAVVPSVAETPQVAETYKGLELVEQAIEAHQKAHDLLVQFLAQAKSGGNV